ncbi:ABC transporter substrate-binding protein [Kitasatospora sp. NPDC094019]|uniref:ABC transporter substrate-binding protein n=1 Tax=Kitasatospora sp. NPDC094019 TaxID=3364091 RepID=UPI0037FDF70D
MLSSHLSGRFRKLTGLTAIVLLTGSALAGCGSGAASSADRAEGHALTVGLTYVPNIQFAPFYVAESLGYYKDAGLKVDLHHHSFTDAQFGALAAGQEDVVFAGGDEMLQARSQSVPVVDIATLYTRYPVAVMVRADSPVKQAEDLKGRTIGTPGPYGETYFALLALLQSAGLSASDVQVQNIGFTQQAALIGNKVDAVTGYLNNDAVQFAQSGTAVRTIQPSGSADALPLVAAGLGTGQETLKNRSADLKAFLAATFKGVQYTVDHPDQAVDLSKKFVPGLDDSKKQADALAVLKETVPLLQSSGAKPGYNDPAVWDRMEEFMRSHSLLTKPVTVKEAFDNSLLP